MTAPTDELERWRAAWPAALAAWGRATRVHPPVLHAERVPDAGSFAWYDGARVEVHIDVADAVARGLTDHAVAVLAHEIGHHLLAPGDRRTGVRIAARVRAGLVDADELVGPVANLWNDLLVNDRLQRSRAADLVGVWHALGRPTDPLMALVLRACELLWDQPRGSLAGTAARVDESAALLCSRLVRAYARDPVGGAAGFASLVRTSLTSDELAAAVPAVRRVTCRDGGQERGLPYGVATDAGLDAPVLHPSLDPAVVGRDGIPPADASAQAGPVFDATTSGSLGDVPSGLLPSALHDVLQALGDPSSAQEVAVAWYRERAAASLVPFPVRRRAAQPDPLLGGLEPWQVGEDLADVDWTGTVTTSPVVVPGMTTVRRQWLDDPAQPPAPRPVDLDLYLDSSGSMPDPKVFSWVALAGAVLALSALRVGARVQATTWSGPGQVAGTDGFTRDPDRVLAAIVAHFGGGTAFPLDLLRRTYLGDGTHAPTATGPTHVAVVSDDGVTTMWPDAQQARDPELVGLAGRVLEVAGGGGSLLLDVAERWRSRVVPPPGYDVYWVDSAQSLVDFARAFAARTWGETGLDRATTGSPTGGVR